MNCYLVRIVGSRDLVGIFFAWDIIELVILIDECVNPSVCEFTELPPGSLYWSDRSVAIPIRRRRNENDNDETDDNDEIPWSRVSLSDSWWYALHTRQRWEAIDPERAGELRKKKRGRKRPNRKSAQIILFQRKDKPEK